MCCCGCCWGSPWKKCDGDDDDGDVAAAAVDLRRRRRMKKMRPKMRRAASGMPTPKPTPSPTARGLLSSSEVLLPPLASAAADVLLGLEDAEVGVDVAMPEDADAEADAADEAVLDCSIRRTASRVK